MLISQTAISHSHERPRCGRLPRSDIKVLATRHDYLQGSAGKRQRPLSRGLSALSWHFCKKQPRWKRKEWLAGENETAAQITGISGASHSGLYSLPSASNEQAGQQHNDESGRPPPSTCDDEGGAPCDSGAGRVCVHDGLYRFVLCSGKTIVGKKAFVKV